MKVTLLTGRTIDQGVGKEHSKLSKKYQENVAICHVDPADLEKLGIKEDENVKVTTNSGSVVLKAVKSKRSSHSGMVFVPYGPWANLVMHYKTHSTGMPSFKGVIAEIRAAADENVLSLMDLLQQNFRKE
jgi:formylmethanofuran dehydrogenase subunit D